MFLLSILSDDPQLDVMPVIKTTYYPWTADSFKPLAYARCAVVEGRGVLFDLQAFEREPDCADRLNILNNSCVAVSFQFSNERKGVLTIVLNADGGYQAYFDESPVAAALDVTTYAGEDEQGWYWGVRFYISQLLIKQYFPVSKIQHGHKMKGNIYKFKRAGSNSHMGAAAPMAHNSIFAAENLESFLAVSY